MLRLTIAALVLLAGPAWAGEAPTDCATERELTSARICIEGACEDTYFCQGAPSMEEAGTEWEEYKNGFGYVLRREGVVLFDGDTILPADVRVTCDGACWPETAPRLSE